jgi:hypothetical protein
MRPISPRLLLLSTLGLVGLLAGPAGAADWTVAPAANHFGAGREDVRYTVNPGGRVEDAIAVVNGGTAPLRLALSATEAAVRLERRDVTVAPGQSAEVPFLVAPSGDAAPGDHAGDIVASGGGRRVEIPIRLRVGGPLKPSLSVEDVEVHYSGGRATVTYTVHNTGNAILTARQAVSLSGPFGRWSVRAGKLADSPALLPGRRWKGSAPLRDVTPALRLTANVTLVPLLTDAAGSTSPLSPATASGHAWTVPWAPLAGVIAVCGLAVAGVARRRSAI